MTAEDMENTKMGVLVRCSHCGATYLEKKNKTSTIIGNSNVFTQGNNNTVILAGGVLNTGFVGGSINTGKCPNCHTRHKVSYVNGNYICNNCGLEW